MRTIHRRWISIMAWGLCAAAHSSHAMTQKTVSDDQMIRDFERYLPELFDVESGHQPLLETLFEINRTPPDIQRNLLELIYNNLISSNPYRDKIATIRTFSRFSPCCEERNIIEKRTIVCKKAIEKLIGSEISDHQTPRIGLCFSGGGVRAAVCADGFMNGLAKTGLLDTALYAASLSGSTWLFGPWYISDKKYEDFADELLIRISNGILGKNIPEQIKDLLSFSSVIVDSMLRRIVFDEIPTVIDLYGVMLGLTLFDKEDKKHLFKAHLGSQLPLVSDGQRPFPLYSATYVTTGKKKSSYAWVEFSPCEIACYKHQAGTVSWGYGRRFENGISKNAAPALPLCYLLGIWGSAISASCGEVFNVALKYLEPKALFEPLKLFIEETIIGDLRLFPAVIRNMTHRLDGAPDAALPSHTIVDAGLECNIPTPPLLYRDLDIIIIADFSANLQSGEELRRAEEYAHKNNLPFPKINYHGLSERNYTIFEDPDKKAPIIVYVPLIKNPRYSPSFDPIHLMKTGYFMNTFNLIYTLNQARTAAGLMEFTVTELKDTLTKLIKRVATQR